MRDLMRKGKKPGIQSPEQLLLGHTASCLAQVGVWESNVVRVPGSTLGYVSFNGTLQDCGEQ